jgi:hypothetical protein
MGKSQEVLKYNSTQEVFHMKFGKKVMLWAMAVGALYFLLSYHFIVVGNGVKLLRKSSLTLNYTIFNTKGKTNKRILSIDQLREGGIGDLLVEMGRLSEEEYERLWALFEKEDA